MFDLGKPFESGLMLASKAKGYLSSAPLWGRLLVLSAKNETRLKRMTRDKHSSLFVLFVDENFIIKLPPAAKVSVSP